MAIDSQARGLAAAPWSLMAPRLPPDGFGLLARAAKDGQSFPVALLGDSTANETTEWFYLFAQAMGALFPSLRIEHRLWDNNNNRYDVPTVIQAGANGERYFRPNPGGRQIAYSEISALTGDLDLRIKLAADSWAPASQQCLLSHYGSSGSRSWRWNLQQSGGVPVMTFGFTTDGTTEVNSTSNGFTDPGAGNASWLRVLHDVDDGAGGNVVQFFTGGDGINWTLNRSVTNSGTVTRYQATTIPYEVGSRGNGTAPLTGKIFTVQMRDGINGPIVNPQPIDVWRVIQGQASDLGGSPTIYMLNGSQSGQGVTYLSDATRIKQMLPPLWTGLLLLNTGHNENVATTKAMLDTWLTRIRAQFRGKVCTVIQNPQLPISGKADFQAQWTREFGAWGAMNGCDVLDFAHAYLSDPRGLSALVNNSDGIHPLAAGSQLARDAIIKRIAAWV